MQSTVSSKQVQLLCPHILSSTYVYSACSCSDLNSYGMRYMCKHKLFVLLFAMEMTNINILDKTEFQTHEVVNFLQKNNIDLAFKAKKAIGTAAKKKSGAQFREILNTYSDNNVPQTFRTRCQKKPIYQLQWVELQDSNNGRISMCQS